jgi:ligand-binding sensor domain-containing protein
MQSENQGTPAEAPAGSVEKIEGPARPEKPGAAPSAPGSEPPPAKEQTQGITAGPFSQLPQAMPRPIAFVQDSEGDIWAAHRYGLIQFHKGSLEDVKIVLDRNSYDSEFNDELPPINTMAALPEKRIWVGFTNGQVMQYERYEWKTIARPFEAIKKPVAAIAATAKEVFVGSRGLFKWDAGFRRFLVDPNFKEKNVSSFVLSRSGKLYMGGASGLWQYDAEQHTWSHIWKIVGNDRSVRAIYQDQDGSLLLGTDNGVVRVSEKGTVSERFLPGETITAIVTDQHGHQWIGTKESGLKFFDGQQWYTAAKEQGLGLRISALLINNGQLWCGVDGKGTFTAPLAEAEKWMSTFKEHVEVENKLREFSSLCEAARELLKAPAISGDLATEMIDGVLVVFVRGHQACPKDVGYRRADGAIVLIRGRTITLFSEQTRKDITPPQNLPIERTQVVLLDLQDRLWLGTDDLGLHMFSNGQWQSYGSEQQLYDNPVTSILEENGSIWIGTSPHYNEEQKRYLYSNLHLYSSEGWFHFGPEQGLIFANTLTLAVRKDGTLVMGGMAGLSLIDKKGQVTNYGKEQGLDPSYVYSATVDAKDLIWIAHQYYGDGITVMGKTKFHRLDSSHGLSFDRVSLIAHDRAARVWLVAPNGSTGVYPYSLLPKNKVSHPIDKKRVVTRNMFTD